MTSSANYWRVRLGRRKTHRPIAILTCLEFAQVFCVQMYDVYVFVDHLM